MVWRCSLSLCVWMWQLVRQKSISGEKKLIKYNKRLLASHISPIVYILVGWSGVCVLYIYQVYYTCIFSISSYFTFLLSHRHMFKDVTINGTHTNGKGTVPATRICVATKTTHGTHSIKVLNKNCLWTRSVPISGWNWTQYSFDVKVLLWVHCVYVYLLHTHIHKYSWKHI